MTGLVFILGMLMYGLARATQQASIFMERNNEPRWIWLSTPAQIHFYGWFEPIGLFISFFVIRGYKIVPALVTVCIGYFIYWLPYALLYCHLRRKDWFEHNQMYAVGTIRTYLLNKQMSYILFIIACITVTAIGVVYA